MDKRSIYFVSTFHSAETPASAQQPFVKRVSWMAHKKMLHVLLFYRIIRNSLEELTAQTNFTPTTTLVEDPENGRRGYIFVVECAILNAFILDKSICPREHTLVGRKRDTLYFRLELVSGLIGGFSSRKGARCPRSLYQNNLPS